MTSTKSDRRPALSPAGTRSRKTSSSADVWGSSTPCSRKPSTTLRVQRRQGPFAVGRQGDADAQLAELGCALVQGEVDVAPVQADGERQADEPPPMMATSSGRVAPWF
ncbi:hypothetical protein PG997_010124 [Apiospora hydei]|uniref:DUF397 domain-containing protein n=1 Tax=Apiospora hydei TaxID=1337664 RepID=A0ABR1VW49_9PEZI